jgi:polyferredoxin
MGIDIRDGDQLECINCALCIDACDDVMKRINLPTGLIAYDNHDNMARRKAGEPARVRLLRPRVVFYAVALVIVATIMIVSLSTRATMDVTVSRERNPTFVRLSDGSTRNAYVVKIMNRSNDTRTFSLSVDGAGAFASVKAVGVGADAMPFTLVVESDRVRTVRILVTVAPDMAGKPPMDVVFHVADAKTGEATTVQTVLLTRNEP